ncbi:MAG: hypothetical protein CSB55_06805 [Candidatus Cloacimonadota bacterium]|nr:MAG: hypothetical protein CSB55_06805 [Candidatus Cloacimonadota bacterium]
MKLCQRKIQCESKKQQSGDDKTKKVNELIAKTFDSGIGALFFISLKEGIKTRSSNVYLQLNQNIICLVIFLFNKKLTLIMAQKFSVSL